MAHDSNNPPGEFGSYRLVLSERAKNSSGGKPMIFEELSVVSAMGVNVQLPR